MTDLEEDTMTVVDIHSAGHRDDDMTDEKKRAAARADVRADPSVTGVELAARYDMSARWGSKQRTIALAGTQHGATVPKRRAAARVGVPRADENGTDRHAVVVPTARPEPPAARTNGTVAGTAPAVPHVAHSGAVHAITVLGVIVVAGIVAVLSYAHMRHLAIEAGEGWRADLLPFSVDGMMVVASMTLLAHRRAGHTARIAWAALILGVAASLAANIAAAEPTLTGRLIAAWPPVALVVAFELLLEQRRPAKSDDRETR